MRTLQEAQRESVAAFESFMGACLVADWARDKRALFDAAMPDSALPAPAGQLASGGFEPSYAPMPIRAPGTMPGAAQEPLRSNPACRTQHARISEQGARRASETLSCAGRCGWQRGGGGPVRARARLPGRGARPEPRADCQGGL